MMNSPTEISRPIRIATYFICVFLCSILLRYAGHTSLWAGALSGGLGIFVGNLILRFAPRLPKRK